MSKEHGNDDRGKKRKKKRSEIQMAKKLARRRDHGMRVDDDTYQYMVRILELMKKDFPSVEEKLIFANNVYEQTVGHEIEYAYNQVGSRILDSLLKYANLETIQRLVDALLPYLRSLSSDRFASHVLEKIVVVCADRGNKSVVSESRSQENADASIKVSESDVERYNEVALKLSRYFINNVEEFASDTYANHVLRTVIECLGGLIGKPECREKRKAFFGETRAVAQPYKDLLLQTCNRLLKWPRILEFGQDALTSGLLQSVLYSLKDTFPETMTAFVDKITTECFKPGKDRHLSTIFDAECSTRLLEACLAVANPESWSKIYEAYFSANLQRLSLMQNANFSVQRLFDHCAVKDDFEKMLEEISPSFPDILEKGYSGVLVSVAKACLRLQTKQGAFVTELLKALGCETNEKQQRIVVCVSSLKSFEDWENWRKKDDSKSPISLHGSLIVQAVLNFNKPIKMVNSLLETDGEELVLMFEDPKGSRIVDAFMDSKYIGEKSREKFAKKLKGHWSRLASSTHGSRSLDRVWQWARIDQRTRMMEELAEVGESLRSTKSGQIVSSKLNVPLFARNRKDWMDALGKEDKTRALFANIIGDSAKKEK